jgi:hypothetical protein
MSSTNLYGAVMYGAGAFTDRQVEILATFFKRTNKQHTIRRIRFVTPELAIVDIDNEFAESQQCPEASSPHLTACSGHH